MRILLRKFKPDRSLRPVRFILLGLSLTSCAVGPDYVPPQMDVPKQWTEARTNADIRQLETWWQTFQDPLLNQLIKQAVAENLDLKLAANRIRTSRLQYDATIAEALPSLSSHSTVSRRLNNSSSSGGTNSNSGVGVGNQIINIFQLGFDAAWEIDLFGGVQRALEVSDGNTEIEQENQHDSLVSLLSEVARYYIQLRANQQMQRVTLDNLRSQEQSLKLVRVRQRAGLVSTVDIAQSEAQLATIRASLPLYETATKQAIHALAVLLGQTTDKLPARLYSLGTIPASNYAGLAILPTELLRRRPDIRRAERKLMVSNAEIGIATSELYPKISLSAFLGLQNLRITDFTPLGKSMSVAASLTMPIFNWGRIQANIRVKEAMNEQAFITYQATVLNAFKEVEDALVAHQQERHRALALTQAMTAQQLVFHLAHERYRKGLSTYLEVLDAQRAIYSAQRELLDGQAKQSLQLVALCKALGGGWQVATDKF
jgi:NodT family efflux transporter outer membrane factor (OMF) lipoprotein